MALDSFVIAGLAEELNARLSGARIDRVTMPRRDRIILHLRAQEGNVRLLLCSGNAARVHLTAEKFDNPEAPPMLCMLLRKQMGGGRIVSVTQPQHERLLSLRFTAIDELGDVQEKQLICEMMGRMTNLILVDGKNVITACLHPVDPESSPRPVQAGMLYRLPPRQDKPLLWELSPSQLEEICTLCGADDRRLCDRIGGLSPLMAREAVFRGHDDPGTAAQLALFQSLTPQPWLCVRVDGKADFCALEPTQPDIAQRKKYPDFSSLLDDFYREQTKKEDLRAVSGSMRKSMTTLRNRLRRKLAGQEQELLDAESRDTLKRRADLITANLYAIRPGQKQAQLTDYFDPALPTVTVELDPSLTPQENAQRLFSKYSRLKRAEEALRRQIALGQAELEYVENVLFSLDAASDAQEIGEIREELVQGGYLRQSEKGRRKPKPVRFHPREYALADGFTALCGRNNRENDELTHRHAGKNDLWFHARNVAGSHVILLTEGRVPTEEAILQAAQIAAFHSAAGNQPRAAVDYTAVRRVKKPQGARAGMVNYFEYKTVLVEPLEPKA